MQGLQELVDRLQDVRDSIHGCESLSVATTDGLILATTHEDSRQGEHLAALASLLISSAAKGLEAYRAGTCRALDFRGDRQVLVIRLDQVDAFLACVLHPGSQAIGLDDPSLRSVTASIPGALHGESVVTRRFFLERDKHCRITVTHGGVLLGSDAQCDVVVVSSKMSPRHVLVELVGDRVQVTDLETKHGTKVNGRRIDAPTELKPGDRLSVPGARGFTLLALNDDGRVLGRRRKKASAKKAKTSKKKKKKR